MEAGIGPESFDPTELQTLESSDDAHLHGSLDFFELGRRRRDLFLVTQQFAPERRIDDDSLHHRGSRLIFGHSWHGRCKPPSSLLCDQVLAIGTLPARTSLAIYLARGETAINADSYFGAQIPGRFCPNFAYHFRVANHWPQRPDPLEDLVKLHLVSLRAQEYDPIVIDLYIAEHPEIRLLTRDQLSFERHRQATPRYSSVPTIVALSVGLGTLTAGGRHH